MSQYLGFFQKLLRSESSEIRMLANVAGRDDGSVTESNLTKFEEEFGLDPWVSSPGQLSARYSDYSVPAGDEWRLPLLVKLLDQKREMKVMNKNIKSIIGLIDSLCYS